MSPKTPRLSAMEVVRRLKKLGFVEASQVGSHLKLFQPATRRIAIIPMHGNQASPIGTLKSIERQSGVIF